MVLGTIKPVKIEDQMTSSYLDYAMSVIVSRALPDVRDGLKPVHRRILYAMNDMGLASGPHRKSARIVGEVLGKYHPHGDASVYEAMIRMAQDFSMRYPLVDGQGNLGSVDNDPPAAMRYTEARLAKIAVEMLVDIEKDTVDFMPNFDDSLKEPVVLPTRLPNLLLNGSAGIAVGMATNIPPHNLTEVCNAIAYLIDNPEATIEDLSKFIKGPDFPTAGIILGYEGIRNAYTTGQGKIVVRARVLNATGSAGRKQIVVTELPYQTNKAALVETIAELVKSKKIEGISELRDESDRQGMRVVIELKREAQPESILNNLYKHTAMQSAFYINMLALVDGQPRVVSLKEALQYFIDFRQVVITRRSRFELKEAEARAHILEGLKIALDSIDKIIATIRKAETAEEARKDLMSGFGLTQIQAQAILDMQLRRLASLERKKIQDEYEALVKTISYLTELLANPRRMLPLIKQEVDELKSKYGDARRTEIVQQGVLEFSEEDLIPHQRVVLTLSERGFIKRVPSRAFTPQHRGGKGIIGMVTRESDAVRLLTVCDTHDNLFFFTNKGKVFHLKCYEVPADSSRVTKGTAVVNLFSVSEGEKVTAMVAVTNFVPDAYMVMATCKGEIKKTTVNSFAAVRASGLIAMDLEEGDELVSACLAADQDDVIAVSKRGYAIRFAVSSLRSSSRRSGGVRAMRIEEGDCAVSMGKVEPDSFLLVITANGFGKLAEIDQFPAQHRAGRGVRTFWVSAESGELTGARVVQATDQVMIMSAEGLVTRTPVKEKDPGQGIPVQRRSTKRKVRLMKLDSGDSVIAITSFGASVAAEAAKADAATPEIPAKAEPPAKSPKPEPPKPKRLL